MSKFFVPDHVLYVCLGSKCTKKGAKQAYKFLKSELKDSRYKNCDVILTECTDHCKFAPVLCLQPENAWLKEYSEKKIRKLLESLEGPVS